VKDGRKKALEKLNRQQVVWGYCRVSDSKKGDLQRQKLEIHEYANKEGWNVEQIICTKVSSRKTEAERGIDKLKAAAEAGDVDIVIFSELSRLGRSAGEIARLIDFFVREHGLELHFNQPRIILTPKPMDTTTKVMLSTFSLLAELERDLISERTKSGLAARKAAGVVLGRPKMVSKLDPKEDEIHGMVKLGIKQKAIAKKMGCTEATLSNWLKPRKREWMLGDAKEE
jgi:DNA invertase Pin-like site-specific DNA recombinase